MVVFPNAKINIGLNVVAKRSDGFHNIESIFYPVKAMYDVLEIVESEQLSFSSTGISIPGNIENNLCVKAYHLIKADFDIPFVKIHLHKVIPIGAGLGGGSADAAFMLTALNELFNLQLNDSQEEYDKVIDGNKELLDWYSFLTMFKEINFTKVQKDKSYSDLSFCTFVKNLMIRF